MISRGTLRRRPADAEVSSRFGKADRDAQAVRGYYEQNLNAAMGQTSGKEKEFSDGAIEFRDSTKRRSARDSGGDVRSDSADAIRRGGSSDGGSN